MPIVTAIIILILGAIGMTKRCSGSDGVAYSYNRPGGDTLSVAIEMSPLTYSLHNDTAEGFDYQILKDIATEHGIAVEFYPIAQLEPAFRELNDNKYDLLVASMPATNTLKQYFPLTDAVYLDKQVLVQRADTSGFGPVRNQKELLGDTVWVPEASPNLTRLRNMSRELGDTIFIQTMPQYSSEHLVILTALGDIKQSVVNEGIARHIAADYPQLDISTPISFNQFQCWAVNPRKPALLDSLNHWLSDFKTTEQYQQLVQKYL